MNTFKDHIAKQKYIAIQYNKETQNNLRNWAKENGYDLTKKYGGEIQKETDFDFHTTIFHSINPIMLFNQEMKTEPSEVFIKGFEFLGEEKNIPVLLLEFAGQLKNIRKHYEKMGLLDKWESYKPHISVSYSSTFEPKTLPTFKLIFDKLIIEDILE